MNMKRIRSLHDLLGDNNSDHHHHLDQSIAIAKCLVFLSKEKEEIPSSPQIIDHHHPHHLMTDKFQSSRVFECKTCNRQFASFQALGGHRASHKKPRSSSTTGAGDEADQPLPSKPKSTHECSVCGLEFSIGQALGGHMRRHRNNNDDGNHRLEKGGGGHGGAGGVGFLKSPPLMEVEEIRATSRPIVNRSVSGKRVLLSLDLNLTPFENGLDCLNLGRSAPMVDCFF